MMQNSTDFGTMDIPKLFRMMFVPTLLDMTLSATINIADGISVGRGVGSDALTAVNTVAPFFMLVTGTGSMFGVGASIVTSTYLSHQRIKVANINITQTLSVLLCIMLSLSLLVMTFRAEVALLLDNSEQLLPSVLKYMNWIVPFLAFYMLLNIGLFTTRLDGSPTYAMLCSAILVLINLTLDYIFVSPSHRELMGAALASAIPVIVGSIMIVVYIVGSSKALHLYCPRFSLKSILLTICNIGYMVRLGSPALLTEAAIVCVTLVGNYIFTRYLGEDGVAAYSVTCYYFPIVFMANNAIVQSIQPIISHNYDIQQWKRARQAFKLALLCAVACGGLACMGTILFCSKVSSLFLGNHGNAYEIAISDTPYFSLGYVSFTLNIVYIGYYQSIERFKPATLFIVLRGIVTITLSFMYLPVVCGAKGVWLVIFLSELITFVIIVVCYLLKHIRAWKRRFARK